VFAVELARAHAPAFLPEAELAVQLARRPVAGVDLQLDLLDAAAPAAGERLPQQAGAEPTTAPR